MFSIITEMEHESNSILLATEVDIKEVPDFEGEPHTTFRTRRVSLRQLDILWEFLNSHTDVAFAYNRSLQAKDHAKKKWTEIAEALNAQDGVYKEWNMWSKYWVDYKAKLKKRASVIRSAQCTGGPATEQPLSDIDKKFLQILGEDFGQGLPGVRVEPLSEEPRQEAPGSRTPPEHSLGSRPPGGGARRRGRGRRAPPMSREAARRALVECARLRAHAAERGSLAAERRTKAAERTSTALEGIQRTLQTIERFILGTSSSADK